MTKLSEIKGKAKTYWNENKDLVIDCCKIAAAISISSYGCYVCGYRKGYVTAGIGYGAGAMQWLEKTFPNKGYAMELAKYYDSLCKK